MAGGRNLFIQGIKELGLDITKKQEDQFLKYYEILVETNKVMNLTAITELDEVIVKHFIDSLLIVKSIDMNQCNNLIDVGTGAGFPGIPIKIMFPNINVTLLDSLNKRLKFLNNVIEELKLSNIDTVHGRAEDLGHNSNYREQFDLCVSRAVANLSTLSEYCIPFVKINGKFVSYKSSVSSEEIMESEKAIKVLGGKIISKDILELPCSDMKRTLVVINKIKSVSKKYPRRAGIPSKEPIK